MIGQVSRRLYPTTARLLQLGVTFFCGPVLVEKGLKGRLFGYSQDVDVSPMFSFLFLSYSLPYAAARLIWLPRVGPRWVGNQCVNLDVCCNAALVCAPPPTLHCFLYSSASKLARKSPSREGAFHRQRCWFLRTCQGRSRAIPPQTSSPRNACFALAAARSAEKWEISELADSQGVVDVEFVVVADGRNNCQHGDRMTAVGGIDLIRCDLI